MVGVLPVGDWIDQDVQAAYGFIFSKQLGRVHGKHHRTYRHRHRRNRCRVFGLRQNYRERLRQFEEMYVEQYWKLIDQLSLEVLKALGPAQASPDDEKIIRRYTLLSEDELQLRASGYISDST